MKRIALAFLVTAGLAASVARADHNSRVTVHGSVTIGHPAPTVVYAPAPAYTAHGYGHNHYAPPARGYWKEIVVKTWVPERCLMSRDRWGRPVRIVEPGYYTYRTDRVWVDASRGHHDHDNRGRYSYGYGRR